MRIEFIKETGTLIKTKELDNMWKKKPNRNRLQWGARYNQINQDKSKEEKCMKCKPEYTDTRNETQ